MSYNNCLIVIIGTGFSGLAMGIKLKQAGIDDFIILERGRDVGGTWRDNHYPGAACDVPSHLYSFSFEPNRRWTRAFSPQSEILEYLRHCAKKYQIMSHIRFGANVCSASYDEPTAQWRIKCDDGSEYIARFFITGTGGLSRPVYPDIPGLKEFSGAIFHSAEWNHKVDLSGKSVAVIGTGASAIQIVPAIAAKVAKLNLFQRSAAWIMPKNDRAYNQWQMWLKVNLPGYERLMRWGIFWRLETFGVSLRFPKLMAFYQKFFIHYLRQQVADPNLRAKLTPSYLPGCKRILLSDDFYPAVTRENVHVITDGIDHVEAKGIVTKSGQHIPVDVIICATGFQAAEACAPFPIFGRNGRQLSDVWSAGAEAYRGTTVSGFPNLFAIVGPNTGLGHTSMVLMIEAQVRYVVDALQKILGKHLKSVEINHQAQGHYNRLLADQLANMVWAKGGCVSWYQTSQGKNTTLWPRSTIAFRLKTWKFDLHNYMCEPHTNSSVQSQRR